MSSTSWKLLGRKQGGNMKNNRNVKSNQSYNNNGNWNTVYSDDDIKRLAYYNIDLPHVVGIGTQTPFSKLSFGDSSNSGYHPDSNGNIETTNGLTPGKLSSIALHEVTRNEENQPERRGQEFNGIGYVTNLMNVRNIDKNNTEANGVAIFSNKFAATEDTSQKTDKAIMYVTDSKHVQIGGVPTGYNLIDRNLQLLGSENQSFNATTQETGPNIIFDVSGSMHVNGFINFLKNGNNSSGPPAQIQDNPANQLEFKDGVIKYAVDASKNLTTNRAAPEGAIFVGWEKETGTNTLVPKPRLYIMVNGVQKRIATEEDTAFFGDDGSGGGTGFPITGDIGNSGVGRFYIFRNNSDNPGNTMINTFSSVNGDFSTATGGDKPAPTVNYDTNGQPTANSPAISQSLQVIGNLSVFDFHTGGTNGTKMNISQFNDMKKVLTSEIYQAAVQLTQNNEYTGKELGTIYTDRHIMIGGFKDAGTTFNFFGSAIDISGGTIGKPVMRAITGANKGSIKSSNPTDSIIIGNTPPGDFATKNAECILVGENARYENNENTLVMGTNNTVKNTKNSIIVGKNITASFDSDTDGVVALGEGDATVDFDAKDRIVFFTKDPVNSAKKALTIDNSGNVTIKENLNVLGKHVHLQVQHVVAEDSEIELNASASGDNPSVGATTLSGTDAGGLCLFTDAGNDSRKAKFSYDIDNSRWTTANSKVGAGQNPVGLAVGDTPGSEQFVVKSDGDLHIGTGTVSKFLVQASSGNVDISGDVNILGSLNTSVVGGGLFTTVNASDSITAGDVGNSKYRVTASSGDVDMSGNLVVNSKYRVTASSGDVDMSGNLIVNSKYRVTASSGDVDMSGNLVVKGNEGIELKHGDFIKNTSSGTFSIGKTGVTTTKLLTVSGNLQLSGEADPGIGDGPKITLKSSDPAGDIGSIDLNVSQNATGTVFGTVNIDKTFNVATNSIRNLIKINGGYDNNESQGKRKGVSFDISSNPAGDEVTNVKISGNLDVDGIVDPNGLILNNHILTDTEESNMANDTIGIFNQNGVLKFVHKNNNVMQAAQTIITDTSTITNQTLTSPEIAQIKNSGATLTLPTSTGTIALQSEITSSSSSSFWTSSDPIELTVTSAANPTWMGITSSSDGKKLAVIEDGGHIYSSSDSGGTWTSPTIVSNSGSETHSWSSICSSDNGEIIAATVAGSDGNIYKTTNSGQNWYGSTTVEREWKDICCKADGSADGFTAIVSNGYIYTEVMHTDDSTLSGPNKGGIQRASQQKWYAIDCSSDGSKLAAVIGGDDGTGGVDTGNIWISTDSGATWNEDTSVGSTKDWRDITMSADGTKLAAVVYGGNIWTSSDSGTTWTEDSSVGSTKNWVSITSSDDGTNLTAAVYGGNIWTSSNSGTTWTEDTSVGATKSWSVITSSADGSTIYATINGNPKLTRFGGDTTFKLVGNVGIGTDSPSQKLDVKTSTANDGICLRNSTDAIIGKMALDSPSVNSGYLALYDGTGGNISKIAGNGDSYFMGGNVGIGTSSPSGRLEVVGSTSLHALRVTGNSNPNAQISASGSNYGLRVETLENAGTYYAAHFSGNVGSSGTVGLYVRDNNRVGIGTATPGFPLEVASTVSNTFPPFTGGSNNNLYFNVSIGYSNDAGGYLLQPSLNSSDVGIKSTGTIWTAGGSFVASSDERIKDNITEVPDDLALQMLRDIDCNYYEYKDKISRGTQKTIGFIAQQVKEHVPMAVSLQKSIIPNEMRVLEATWDGVNMSSDLTDVSGVKYRFYVSNDPSGNDEVMKEIVGNQDNTFTFDKHYNNVFCYGKEVDDFHTLDKQKLFTVNFSATQEIDKIQQEEKTKLAAAEERISVLETENATLKAQLNSIEARLAALEA